MHLISNLRHYAEVYRVQIKNNFVREAVYRTNFLTAVSVDVIWIITEVILFSVIYSHVSTLGSWSREQVYFFLGIFFASDALFTIFFQTNFWTFSDLVNRGELDILLTKPIHPLFLALSRSINLSAAFNIFMGLGIVIRYASSAGFAGGWHWLNVGFWLMIGLVSAVQIRFIFSIWVFWTERSWAITRLYYQFFAFATKPDTIYPKGIRYLIMSAVPFAFIGSVPARALLFGLRPMEYLWVAFTLITFFILNSFLWHQGLRRYQSASS